MKPTTFLSVCSGIEAASAAWMPLGWVPLAYSEIDPAPCHVLHARHGSGRPWFMPDPAAPDLAEDDRRERANAIASVSALPLVPFVGAGSPPPNFGDMSRFMDWPDVPDLDVLCGGTPCQSFSVAGLRGGLDDARGNLMLTFAAIARRYRPRRVVWENVPGVLSSNGGTDFASLLGLLSGRAVTVPAGGWSNSGVVPGIARGYGLAWRVLDAQFFGVAQRRRRVFLVGYLGDWRRAAAVLLERASLRGDPAPRREARAHVAAAAAGGAGGGGAELAGDGGPAGGGRGGSTGVARTLTSSTGGASAKEQQFTFVRADGVPLNALDETPAGSFWNGEQVTSTLDASVAAKRQTMPDKERFMAALVPVAGTIDAAAGRSRGAGTSPAILLPVFTGDGITADPLTANEGCTYTHEGSTFRMHNVVGHAVDLRNGAVGEVTQTLQAGGMGDDRGVCPNAIPHTIGFTAKDYGQDAAADLAPTLRAGVHGASHANGGVMPAVAFKSSHFTRGKDGAPSEVHPPLTADADKGDQDPLVLAPARAARMFVRRLMPSECELLQGFPRGHTLVAYRGKLMTDGPRYKGLGNSWAVPCAGWIGRRMDLLEKLCPTT